MCNDGGDMINAQMADSSYLYVCLSQIKLTVSLTLADKSYASSDNKSFLRIRLTGNNRWRIAVVASEQIVA